MSYGIDEFGRIKGNNNCLTSQSDAELIALRHVNDGSYYCTNCKAKINFTVDHCRNRSNYFEIELSGIASCEDRSRNYNEHIVRVIILNNGSIDSRNTIQKGSWKHMQAVNKTGCHITSIICKGMGYPDDCHQLTQIRRFRDQYLKKQGHIKEVQDYYKNSTFYASKIEQAAEKNPELYLELYNEYIEPSVQAIEINKMEAAFQILNNYLNDIKSNYLI